MPIKGLPWLFVQVDTDEGVTGIGECSDYVATSHLVRGIEALKPLVVGMDAGQIENIWQTIFHRFDDLNGRGYVSHLISAIDIALWDIKGKALDMPVYKLLGGPVRDRVVCYPHTDGRSNDELVDSCKRAVDAGWKFVRWGQPDTGGTFENRGGDGHLEPVESIRIAEEQMALVREAVGPDIQICFDVHTRLDTAHVIAMCKNLEPHRPFFIEDPLRSENPASYRTLARHVSLPIAAGEQWASKWAFREVIEEELINYARIDLCNVGGITEALKITHWCETHYIDIAPHNPLGPVSAAACAALCMASTNVGVLEMPMRPGSFATDLFPVQIEWEDGYAFAPDRPGLGVEFDVDVAESRRVQPGGFAPLLRRNDGAFTNW